MACVCDIQVIERLTTGKKFSTVNVSKLATMRRETDCCSDEDQSAGKLASMLVLGCRG